MVIFYYWTGMFIFSFLAGWLPLVMIKNKEMHDLMSLYGAGLLIGVAFLIVIPEAWVSLVKAFMGTESTTAEEFIDSHGETIAMIIGISLMTGFLIMLTIDKLIFQSYHSHHHKHSHSTGEEVPMEQITRQYEPQTWKNNKTNRNTFEIKHFDLEEEEDLLIGYGARHRNNHHQNEFHDYGFDHQIQNDGFKTRSKPYYKLNRSFSGKIAEPLILYEDEKIIQKEIKRINNALVTLIGLVIHSTADGLSFGCASFASNKNNDNQFGLIIFIAIVLHKWPAAIGFMSYMILEELGTTRIIKFMLIFTLSSPITAMLTYYGLALYTDKIDKHDHTMIYVGVFLFLSAGTFLYVALLHILPEIFNGINSKHHDTSKPDEKQTMISKNIQVLVLIAGWLSPLLLYFFSDE